MIFLYKIETDFCQYEQGRYWRTTDIDQELLHRSYNIPAAIWYDCGQSEWWINGEYKNNNFI